MYFQKVEDNKKINVDLMMAADKFLIKGLLDLCTKFLESNLSVENALEVLIKGELRGVIGTLSTILQHFTYNEGGTYSRINSKVSNCHLLAQTTFLRRL